MTQAREDWAAELARQYIGATLNVPVDTWDKGGRQGAHDLRYELKGRSVAVEVKLVVDEEYRALERRIADTGYVRDARLSRKWDIRLKRGARFNRVVREIPTILMRLEQLGWRNEPLWQLRNIDDETEEILERLRVTSISNYPPTLKHPPGFYLMPQPWGDWDKGIEELPTFVSGLLASPQMERLRIQLANAETDARHAFLFIGWEHMEPFRSIYQEVTTCRLLRLGCHNLLTDYGWQASRSRLGSSLGFKTAAGLKDVRGLSKW
jgi:hypothetical protein